MGAMLLQDTSPSRRQRSLNYAIAASLILHAVVLFVPEVSTPDIHPPGGPTATTVAPPQRLEARLAPIRPPSPMPDALPARPQEERKQILAMKKPKGQQAASRKPKWTVAEKAEMNDFLRELEAQSRTAPTPTPTLAQRSTAMARGAVGRQAEQERDGRAILERIPDSPPVDPFSLEMYLDSLVRKLNQSASFVKSDPRNRGVKTASVMVRLNPNGSLRSFEILNMADQQDEVAFIKSVVERAVPFAAFPPDLRKSAYSLGMLICIMPPGASGGFGFNRMTEGQAC